MSKPIPAAPDDNRSHKGPGDVHQPVRDATKGHRDDEKHNIDEQGNYANVKQNTSNRRSG